MEVTRTPEFLSLNAEKLQALIESDKLNVSCEKDVFDAVNRWYEYDAAGRQQKLPDLIGSLRLNQLDTDFLLRKVQLLPGCEVLALRAITWTTLPTNRTMVSLKFTTPRKDVRNTSEETILLAIGRSEGDVKIFQYDKAEDEWHKYDDMEYDFSSSEMAFVDDSLIFIGGCSDIKPTNVVKSWNIKTKTWSTLPSMAQPRGWPSVISLNGSIYAIGGWTTIIQRTNSVEIYKPGNGWDFVSSMSTARSGAGAVVLNGKIFVMGGWDGSYQLKSVECYEPSSDSWTQCASMNEGHSLPGVAVSNGCIYILGSEMALSCKTVECYDPQNNKWTKICALRDGRYGIGCVSTDDRLWAVGGIPSNSVSVYNSERDEWIEKKPIPKNGRYSCYVVAKTLFESE
ncbi:kelch-like protein 5 [Rhagoletis pomonella]|uniref:kelch-like protein 5 n=1 Tax=Rhagoletis pomonella TaxID=28610 RepID=UPI001780B9F3|nr:kelch-like protein 5 [Rhagoletis pomonella]